MRQHRIRSLDLRRSRVVVVALAVVAALIVPAAERPREAAAAAGTPDVIANLFEWPWPAVANECTTTLGPKGYGAVQVSPPQESITISGHPWWEVYQPVSYQLTSRTGTRAQFTSMVNTCHAAGVKVYVDAVINHMTGQGNTGYGGTTFPNKYTYPGLYSSADFHHYPDRCPQPDNQIHNYGSQAEVQECELVSLADLYTEADYVRTTIAGYLNDLLSLGVDGFRVDAAKHMNPADLAAIKSRLSRSTFLYQEVIYGAGEPVQPSQYLGNGSVLEFRYGTNLKAKFGSGGRIADLQTFGPSWGMEASSSAVVFVDNHDTQRNGTTLSYKDGARYDLATVFGLAWNYGTPNVMSSFDFSSNDQGPPSASNGTVSTPTCGSGWQCEHRRRAIANMVGFHNQVAGTAVANWWSDGNNQIAFSRGSAGFVAVNNSTSALSRTFTTGLPSGTYCDVIHGDVSGSTCTGPTVSVAADGTATASVAAMDALAIHAGSRIGSASASVQVSFGVNATTTWGQNVFVVGSTAALGNWNPAAAVALSAAAYPVWRATVSLPPNTAVQYKYIKKNTDGSVTWESDPNRTVTTGASGSITLNDTWR